MTRKDITDLLQSSMTNINKVLSQISQVEESKDAEVLSAAK
jgi:hypothetical protein